MRTYGRNTIYVKYTEEEVLQADIEKQKTPIPNNNILRII